MAMGFFFFRVGGGAIYASSHQMPYPLVLLQPYSWELLQPKPAPAALLILHPYSIANKASSSFSFNL